MLISNSQLVDCPVLSLHIGTEIARVVEPIIDPDSLKIIAFRVEGKMVRAEETGDILPVDSVREFSRMGLIIDSIDELTKSDDIVKIQQVLRLNFNLIGLKVVTKQKKSKLGKIIGFTLDVESWHVQQIVVQRPVLKAFFDPELRISRQQIVEVNDYQVVVKDEHEKVKSKVQKTTPVDFVPNFINPFREPDFSREVEAGAES